MQIPNVIAIGSGLNHKIDQCIVHVLFFYNLKQHYQLTMNLLLISVGFICLQ